MRMACHAARVLRQRHKAEADMLESDISPEQRKCLESAFEAADKNGDGILSADEYYEIFQTHGLSIGKKDVLWQITVCQSNARGCKMQSRFHSQSVCSSKSFAVDSIRTFVCGMFHIAFYSSFAETLTTMAFVESTNRNILLRN